MKTQGATLKDIQNYGARWGIDEVLCSLRALTVTGRTNMNKDRRKRLQVIYDDLVAVIDEEQEAYDNLPESFQDGERGELMSGGIELLGSARDDIEQVMED